MTVWGFKYLKLTGNLELTQNYRTEFKENLAHEFTVTDGYKWLKVDKQILAYRLWRCWSLCLLHLFWHGCLTLSQKFCTTLKSYSVCTQFVLIFKHVDSIVCFFWSFGFFTINKSDRKSVRQINSGKINLLKKLPPVGIELATATITLLWSLMPNQYGFRIYLPDRISVRFYVRFAYR